MKLSTITILSLAFLAGCSHLPSLHSSDQDKTQPPEQMRKQAYALIDTRPQEAAALFDKLIAQKPDDALAYNGKAVALDHSGNHASAQALYGQALKLSPDSPSIKNNLAMSMILNGQTKGAIALLEPLANQGNKTIRQNLALAYALNGDKKKALAINQEDVSPEEAKENMRFYEEYAKQRKKHSFSPAPAAPAGTGFVEAPAEAKPTPEKPAPVSNELPTSTPADNNFPSQNKR